MRTTLFGQLAADHIAAFVQASAMPSQTRAGCWESESLCRAQSRLWCDGYLEAEILSTAYGYSLRHASGLENFALIASARSGDVDGTYDGALQAAASWVAVDPSRRTVFTREEAPAPAGV